MIESNDKNDEINKNIGNFVNDLIKNSDPIDEFEPKPSSKLRVNSLAELGPESEFKYNLADENLLVMQNYNLVQFKVSQEIWSRTKKPVTIQFKSDTEAEFTDLTTTIFSAEWKLLGFSSKSELYEWQWPWIHINEKNEELIEAVNLFPKQDVHLTRNIIQFDQPLLLDYMLGMLMESMKLKYIHFQPKDKDTFSVFGLRNIKWLSDPLPLDPNLNPNKHEDNGKEFDNFTSLISERLNELKNLNIEFKE